MNTITEGFDAIMAIHKRLPQAPKFLAEEYAELEDCELESILRGSFSYRKLDEEMIHCKQEIRAQLSFRNLLTVIGMMATFEIIFRQLREKDFI